MSKESVTSVGCEELAEGFDLCLRWWLSSPTWATDKEKKILRLKAWSTIHGASAASTLAAYLKALDESLNAYELGLKPQSFNDTTAHFVHVICFDLWISRDFLANPVAPGYRAVIPVPVIKDDLVEEDGVDKETTSDESVVPSQLLSGLLGNAYGGSLYAGLASLLTNIPSYELFDKRISMFQYDGSGSGFDTFFAIRVRGDTSCIKKRLDLKNRLAKMNVVMPMPLSRIGGA
ncbi:hypothetical protein D9758_011158 [Tetrapyrgos nigripes]|uniref:Hydroxymethylglutaryl-coenzyme A synthase C-terminal domain-containing protein n=1 Tax=Tetrapyrgos nigripes TaxID=182062 RepID=A0A8H5CJQ2_9AGAR|nr:hypothetical protein D9758_011158 [Tetrapyrgos nigripes]